MIEIKRTSAGIAIHKTRQRGVEVSAQTMVIEDDLMESFFNEVHPFYQNHLATVASELSKNLRPVGRIRTPGKDVFYMTLDAYLMIQRGNELTKDEAAVLNRLISFSGSADDIRGAKNIARRYNMEGIATMIELVAEGREV